MATRTGYEWADDTIGDVGAVVLLDALFSNSRDATVIVDETGMITYATPAVALLLGFDPASVVGESVFDYLHPDDLAVAADLFERRLTFDGSDQGKELRIRTSSAEWATVIATASLLPDARFGTCAITMIADDDNVNRERLLRRRIVVAEYVNRLGVDLVAAPDSAAVVDRIREALGEVALLTGADCAGLYVERRQRGPIDSIAEWHSSAHPDARAIDVSGDEPVEELLARHVVVDDLGALADGHRDRRLLALASAEPGVGLLATPFRSGGQRGTLVLMRFGGGPSWWESDSELVRGVANLVGRALQTTWSEELLTLTYQLGPVGFSIRTFDGVFVDCNQRYLDVYGITRERAASMSLFEVLLPEYHDGVRDLHHRLINQDLDRFVTEVEVRRGDGSTMWVRTNVVPMTIPGSTERFVLTAVENITEMQQQRIELEHAASHDSLTGVANRATMCKAIEHHAATTGALPGLLMIDLDDFKLVNDRDGHAAGDHVLATVAERIAGVLRGSDVVARLGGDEFAVVAPGLVGSGVDGLAQRLQRAVAPPIEFGDGTIHQTMSIGVALGEDCNDLADLLAKADRALYAAKRAGRTCHRTFEPSMLDEPLG
jgi:diguanylate cyclase (GGDEF)-like protein/PAS domain S-box-containing protein